jgi:single-stranded-DNA-specific exonuclease
MEKIWKIKDKKRNLNPGLAEKYHPIILELLAKRGIAEEDEIKKYFNFDYEKDLIDPFLFSGMKKATERISKAIKNKEVIAIFGDYDADGVTAAVVLYETLKDLGAEKIVCYIPDRQLEGYGMNEKAVEYLSEQKVNIIITVDCGITNVKEVDKARDMKMDVIITDHHHIPPKIPASCAVVNPNKDKSEISDEKLAGVGVVFKLAQALYQKMAPEKKEQLKWALDLVAIGTIADCVPLLKENRILAKYGLIVLSKTRRAGLKEMFQTGRIKISENCVPDTHQVAYQIAPRINAAGRMDHASASFKLLTEKNRVIARDMALEAEIKNQERQKITGEIFREVQILANNSFRDKKFIFAENKHWPVGILGLVAGKIAEYFKKPTAIFQRQEKEFVGSFRSIPEVDIIKAIEKCSDLLSKFGGHSQAAGVSVSIENFEKFYEKISGLIENDLNGKEIVSQIEFDLEINPDDINWELAGEIKKMEPFGTENEEPVFCARNMIIGDCKIVGNGQKHWKFLLKAENGSPKIFDAIGFSLAENFPQIKKNDKIDIVFHIQEDEWNGNKKIQLEILDLKLRTQDVKPEKIYGK